MVCSHVFIDFKKFQNAKVLAFDFTEKRQCAAKTDQNSIFLGHEANILDRLYLMVHYTSFTYFKKIQISTQKAMVLTFGFTEKHQFAAKTDRNRLV
jgi:hypothetical protein